MKRDHPCAGRLLLSDGPRWMQYMTLQHDRDWRRLSSRVPPNPRVWIGRNAEAFDIMQQIRNRARDSYKRRQHGES